MSDKATGSTYACPCPVVAWGCLTAVRSWRWLTEDAHDYEHDYEHEDENEGQDVHVVVRVRVLVPVFVHQEIRARAREGLWD